MAEVLEGRWELGARIGSGGYGTVFEGRDLKLGRTVAVKRLSHPSPQAVLRTRREIDALARLRHPHVVGLLDAGTDEHGHPYLVLERVKGRSLAELVNERPLEPRRAARVIKDAARGIAEAHERGILHRDLKPENILVEDGDGRGRVVDFGTALLLDEASQLSRTGAPGTPLYMAPEQFSSQPRSSRQSDVYSLGASLYFCLTGRPPFVAEALPGLVAKVLDDPPTPPRDLERSIPPGLEALVLRCLEKEPARRPGSAGALAGELERFLARSEEPASPALDLAPESDEIISPEPVPDDEVAPDAARGSASGSARRKAESPPFGEDALRWLIAPRRLARVAVGVVLLVVIVKLGRAGWARWEGTRPRRGGQPAAGGETPRPPPREVVRRPSSPRPAPPAPAAQAKELLAQALEHLRGARRDEARTALEKATTLDPELREAWAELGRLLFAGGEAAAAVEPLGRAMAHRPPDAELLSLRAEAWQRQGLTDRALEDWLAATRADPKRVDAWAAAARIQIGRGSASASVAEFEVDRALALAPQRADLHRLRGEALLLQNKAEAAEAAFTRSLELEPGSRAGLRGRADARRRRGDQAGAAADMEALDQLPPGDPPPAGAKPDALEPPREWPRSVARGLGRPPPPHEVSFEATWSLIDTTELQGKATDWRGMVNLGHALGARGEWAAALASYERAVEAAPDRPEPRLARADALLVLLRVDDALAEYERALRLDDSLAAARGRALAMALQGRLEEADEALAALERRGKNAAVYAVLAHLRELQGRPREALDELERARRLGKSSALELQRARLLLQNGEPGGARDELELLFARRPGDPDGLIVLGAIEVVEGRAVQALEVCEVLLGGSTRADARVLRGLARAQLGELDEAWSDVEVALGREGAPPEAFAARGFLRMARKQPGARDDLLRFLTLHPNHPAAPAVRSALR